MAAKRVRYVNVIPNAKIKKEVIISDEEDLVTCKICLKTFASDTALRNHTRIEHIDIFEAAKGDASQWTQQDEGSEKKKIKLKVKEDPDAALKKQQLIAEMEPTSIMSLASEDVSYIIIKADPDELKKRKVEKPVTVKPEKLLTTKKERGTEPKAISGPFECLQPRSGPLSSSAPVSESIPLCHQLFLSCCEYSAHLRDDHTRRRRGLRCQVCERPLAAQDQPAPFACEVCGAGFEVAEELAVHALHAHVKIKPYECNVCHKWFTQQGGVAQHMRMHTGVRPFPCTFCPKSFTQKSGLDQHLRIHTKVKPYRCVVCQKSFCQSVHLKQHMRTHTNVAPFQCGVCDKRFKQSSHLNYHLKNHSTATLTNEQRATYQRLLSTIAETNTVNTEANVETNTQETQTLETEVCEEDEVQVMIYESAEVEYILGDTEETEGAACVVEEQETV